MAAAQHKMLGSCRLGNFSFSPMERVTWKCVNKSVIMEKAALPNARINNFGAYLHSPPSSLEEAQIYSNWVVYVPEEKTFYLEGETLLPGNINTSTTRLEDEWKKIKEGPPFFCNTQ
jgi:hypothetical protein